MSYKDTGLIFAGNVYMAPIVNEVPTDFAGPINVTQLELTPPSPEAIDRTSFQRDTYGQVLDSVNLPGEAPRMSMSFDSLPALLLADALAQAAREDRLRADHRIHLRCEVSAADVIEHFEDFRTDPMVGLASLMDHAPGQRHRCHGSA